MLKTEFPVPTMHQMIQASLLELRQARTLEDADRMARAERRMNALLDQLAQRVAGAQ